MKRIILQFIFSFFVFSFVHSQQYSFSENPIPTATCSSTVPPVTSTCTIGANTLTITISGTNLKCNSDNSGTATVAVSGGVSPYTYQWTPTGQTTPTATGFAAGSKSCEIWDATGASSCIVSIDLCEPNPLFVNLSPPPQNPSCFGTCDGTATASVPANSGTPPYTYSWNLTPVQTTPTATGLCNGTQTVVVTDANGCVKTKTATLVQPFPIATNGNSTNILCFGQCTGSASVAPTGGTAPYTYSWNTGATTTSINNLCAGNYACTISDSHTCTITYSTTITQPPALTLSVTSTNVTCNSACNGTATATAGGGVPNYTYSWSPGGYTTSAVTGLCANNYTVTLTDANGCTKTSTVAITQPGAISVAPTATNILCFGQCNGVVNANPSGGTLPYTFAWSPGGCSVNSCSGLCAGTYTVNVSDANGCAKSGTVSITQPTQLTLGMSKTDAICPGICNGTGTASASGGTTPYTYSWSNGQTTSAISGLCSGTYTITVTDKNNCTATGSININMPLPLLTNITVTKNVSCFGQCDGAAQSNPSGGTPPYTYSWNTGQTTQSVSGLCAGMHTLNLTDANGCLTIGTYTVTQPATFSVSIASATPNPLNCNGDCNGTATSNVSGGTAPYTYSWTTGASTPAITGLCKGTYSLTVTDANGCTANTSVIFVEPTTLSVTISSSNPTCNGNCNGSISAVAGGGTPAYTFSWLPGNQITSNISSQCAGNYTITVRDNKGCSNTQTITLTSPATLAANASVVNNVLCAGQNNGTAVSNPTGGTAPFTYSWSNGSSAQTATGLSSGSYNVTVTDSKGCTAIGTVNITQPTALSSNISSTTSSCTLCNGTANVTTSGGTLPYTFLWNSTPAQSTQNANGLCVGNYTVTVTDANGCTNSLVATINPVVTLSVTVSGTQVSCPNSCDGIATATPFGGGNPYTYSWSTAPIQTSQSATGLCAGTYSVTVADKNGCISTNTLTFTNPAPLTITMASTSASCGICNGSSTATPSGGTGAYTYTWSGFPVQTTASATGLCSGNYTVTVKDANGCSLTNTVAVGNIPAISSAPSITLATCGSSDGAVCAGASGGTPAYTYLWMPGNLTTSCITGLAVGIYTVTITDAAGCAQTFSDAVGNIAGPTISTNWQTNPKCNASCDGSISVTASGVNSPFTYSWNTSPVQTTSSISNLCPGTYIVQAINSVNCSSFSSFTLPNPAQMNLNPTITNVSCNGGSNGNICFAPSGGNSPYTYQWLPGGQTTSCRNNLSAGTYSVVVTDAGGCDDTIAVPVTQPALLNVSISSSNVTCNGNCNGTATANITGGTTLYTYAWSTGAPLPSIVGLCPNNYSITVTDANGCTATGTVVITQPAVLTSTISATNITCNALCNGTATMNASGGTIPYSYLWNTTPNQTTSAISGLCVGNYQSTVTDANGCASSQSVSITQPAAISVTVAPTNASCSGGCDGKATANVSGGTTPYTYTWNPGALTGSSVTGLCTGSYTLTVTDANSCPDPTIFSISAPALLQANITNVSPSCFGGCNGTATSSPIGGTGAYTYSWNTSPVQTTATATGLCSGSYTLTLSDANGCFINQPVTIAAPPQLTQASGVAGATCLLCNGSISLIASGGTSPYTFHWSTGATTATLTGLCAGVYIDTVEDAKGCLVTDTIGVSNTSGPTIFVVGANITCHGACDGTATVSTATGNGPPWIYSWFPNNQTTQTITALCPNQYFATVTDTFGCKTVSPINITEPAQLASNPSSTNATCFGICNGSITLNPAGGTGAYTYSWSNGATTQNITGQCAGNYTVILTDANNCSLTTTITIGQNTILTSTVTSTNDLCNSSCDGTANIIISGGTLPYTYSWCNAQTTTAVTGLCAGTCTAVVTDAIGCMKIDSAVIAQPNPLLANITITNPLCNNSCDGSLSSVPTGGTAPYTYLWMPGNATTNSISGLCAGNYTLNISDANNCIATTTIALTNPLPITSTHTVTDASCANVCDGAVDITPSGGTGTYTFLWFPNAQATQNISNVCAGLDSVVIKDANGCSFTDTMTVGVVTLVIADAGPDTSFCTGGTATLCNNSLNAASIAWFQLPAWTSVGTTNCVNVSPPAGTTLFALIASNGICSDTDTVAVIVNNIPVVVPPVSDTICLGDSATLCASGAATYQWFTLPAWTPFATGTCIKVSPSVGTTWFGIIGMNGVCSDSDSVAVTVLAMPMAVAPNDTAFCFGNSITLCSNSTNAVSQAWYNLPSWTQIDTAKCITVTPPSGINDFALIATNGMCSDTDTVSVNVYAAPPVNAGPDVSILAGNGTVFSATAGAGIYLWSPATGLNCVTCLNPTATPTVTTTYTLLVTDAGGCTSSDSITVTVINGVVPNDGLSPNGDGINDVWIIPGIEKFPEAKVEVYNRWGELLYSSIGYTTPWDAKYKGKDLPVGTYYYVIDMHNDLVKEPITGPITIMR